MKKIIAISFIFALMFACTDMLAVEEESSNLGATTRGEIVKSGTTGANFLKIDVGARATGMGSAYGAVADDMSSIYWNVAGMADITDISVEVDYSQWFANLTHTYLGVGIPVGDGYTVGLAAVSYGADDIPITTINRPEGTGAEYAIKDKLFAASFAGYLTTQFSFGVTAKYIYNAFADVHASGLAFDVGTMYDTEIYGVKLGFVIQNIGMEQKYSGQDLSTLVQMHDGFYESSVDAEYVSYDFSTPLTFRASMSSEVINDETHKLIVAGDFLTVSDAKEQFMLGAEYTWKDLLILRSGYRINHDVFGYSGGIGLKYDGPGFGGRIDYSIAPTEILGWINRVSVSMDFGAM